MSDAPEHIASPSSSSTPATAASAAATPHDTSISTSSSTTITPALSAHLRLQTLSYLIYGHANPTPSPSRAPLPSHPILIRLSDALSSLSAVQQSGGKPIARFLQDWDRNADLLHPLSSTFQSTTEGGSVGTWDAEQQSSYLLSQQTELVEALKTLERIQSLVEQRGVLDGEKSRNLARTTTDPTTSTRLATLQAEATEEANRAKAIQDRVLALVHGWSNYTSTLSQAFTLLDAELLTLERQVVALERQQDVTR